MGLGFGGGAAGFAGHPASGAEQAGHEVGDGEVDVEVGPVQAVAVAEDLDVGEVGVARPFQALGEVGREGEGAAVGQLDDDPPAGCIEACRARARLAP